MSAIPTPFTPKKKLELSHWRILTYITSSGQKVYCLGGHITKALNFPIEDMGKFHVTPPMVECFRNRVLVTSGTQYFLKDPDLEWFKRHNQTLGRVDLIHSFYLNMFLKRTLKR